MPKLPPQGTKTFDLVDYTKLSDVESFCHAIGYRRVSRKDGSALAVRADVLERLARDTYKLAEVAKKAEDAKPDAGFAADPALCKLADCEEADLEALLFALGYRRAGSAGGVNTYVRRGPNRNRGARKRSAVETESGATESTGRSKIKRRQKKPDPALAARKAAAREREEKRMADSPFAILKQLAIGGE